MRPLRSAHRTAVTPLKWRLVILLSFVLARPHLGAQRVEEFPLRTMDSHAAVATPEEITYQPRGLDDRGFNRVLRKVTVPTLTVYFPAAPQHRGAALVVIPGGGYDGIVIDREGHAVARYFQMQGIMSAVLKYRLPGPATFAAGVPAPQQDALAAIRFLRQHAREWRIDPARIGVMGASAGGHLAGSAAILGERADGSRPDFAVLLYPVVSLEPPWAHVGSRERLLGTDASPARVAEFSLHRRTRPGLPPFFLVHARDDQTVSVENSVLLETALTQAGVPVEFLAVAGGGHGFALGRTEESARWKDRVLRWLDALP